MKKLAFLLLVFATGAYAGAAYILGGQARDRYFDLVREYGRSGFVALDSQSYDRGFLRSTARTRVEIPLSGSASAEAQGTGRVLRFTVRHELRHGPLPDLFPGFSLQPALAVMESSVDDEPSAESAELFRDIPELARASSTVRIGFSGEIDGSLAVPAFVKVEGRERLAWDGLTVNLVHDPLAGTYRGDFGLPGMSLESGQGRFGLRGLSGTFDLAEVLPMLFVGQVRSDVAAMNMTQPDAQPLHISDLRVATDSTCDGVTAGFVQKLDIASVRYGDNAFGPVSCDIEARHLDALALSEFQTRLRLLAGAPEADLESVSAQVGELYLTLFAKLLAGRPEVRISRLRLGTPRGDLTGDLRVRSDAPEGLMAANPLLMLPYVEAEAEVSAHEELLAGLVALDIRAKDQAVTEEAAEGLARQRVREEIGSLVSRGLLERDGGNIVGRALLKNGRLTVNGQETPLF